MTCAQLRIGVRRRTAGQEHGGRHRLPGDAVMLACPSDHHIQEGAAAAAEIASSGWLVCVGIDARSAETRFGNMRRGDRLSGDAYRIAEFIGKPAGPRTAIFAASDEFCRSAGIFAFRDSDYLAELERASRHELIATPRRVHASAYHQHLPITRARRIIGQRAQS